MTSWEDEDELFRALQTMEPCANCGKNGSSIPCMGGCKKVYYCTSICMMNHASAHRLRCRNLRCSKFNDSDDDDEEYDDSEEEYDSDDDSEEEKPKKSKTSVDAATEKRIEEKILKRLQHQEDARIALAIEERMASNHVTSWKDKKMNNIAQSVKDSLVSPSEEKEGDKTKLLNTLGNLNMLDAKDRIRQQLVEPPKSPMTSSKKVKSSPEWNHHTPEFKQIKIVVMHEAGAAAAALEFNSTSVKNVLHTDLVVSHIEKEDVLTHVDGKTITSDTSTEELKPLISKSTMLRFKTSSASTAIRNYSIPWKNGPLGLTLKDDGSLEAIPVVHRVMTNGAASKGNIAVGDILVGINNIDTIALGCVLTMSVLKKVQLPAKLTFRGRGGSTSTTSTRDSSTSRKMAYDVHWNEGPLGLTIIPGESSVSLPIIKRVTGKGISKGIEEAQVGDCLVSINQKLVANMSFDEVVETLKAIAKPVVLSFTAPQKKRRNSVGVYDIVWRQGPLGLTIDSLADKKGAFIKRVNVTEERTAASVSLANLRHNVIGDRLVEINKNHVLTMPFDDIVKMLQSVERPATLRFITSNSISGLAASRKSEVSETCNNSETKSEVMTDSSSSSSSSSAAMLPSSITTEDTSKKVEVSNTYDLEWKEGPLGISLHASDPPKLVFPFIKRLTGGGLLLPPSVLGDELIAINDKSTEGSSFLRTMEILRKSPKPLKLTFNKRELDPAYSGGASSARASSSSSASSEAPGSSPSIISAVSEPFPRSNSSMFVAAAAPTAVAAITESSSSLHTPFVDGRNGSVNHQNIVQSVKKQQSG